MRILFLISFLITLCGFGCSAHAMSKPMDHAKNQPATVKVPPVAVPVPHESGANRVYIAKWDSIPQGTEWTQIVLDAIDDFGGGLISMSAPKDSAKYCGGYSTMGENDKRQVLLGLVSAMAYQESKFDPSNKYTECSSKPTTYGKSGKWFSSKGKWCIPGHKKDGGIAISRGLIQMSLQSAQSYGCEANEPKDLHDPRINLRCAVKVLNNWIVKDQYFGTKIGKTHMGGGRYWSVMRDSSDSQPKIKAFVKTMPLCLNAA